MRLCWYVARLHLHKDQHEGEIRHRWSLIIPCLLFYYYCYLFCCIPSTEYLACPQRQAVQRRRLDFETNCQQEAELLQKCWIAFLGCVPRPQRRPLPGLLPRLEEHGLTTRWPLAWARVCEVAWGDLCVSPVVVPSLSLSFRVPLPFPSVLQENSEKVSAVWQRCTKNKDIQPLSVWVRRERCQIQCHCCLARGSCRWQETLHLFGKFGCPNIAGAVMMIQQKLKYYLLFIVYWRTE